MLRAKAFVAMGRYLAAFGLALTFGPGCGGTDVTFEYIPVCDGKQQESEKTVDEPFDADGDGYFDMLNEDCRTVYMVEGLDCNDNDPNVHPGAEEVGCNGMDDDCRAETPDEIDFDEDGVGECTDCDDSNPLIRPGFAETQCNGVDDDCDPTTEDAPDFDVDGLSVCEDCDDTDAFDSEDQDGDGWTPCAGDCNDYEVTIYPGAPEICDGLDNNCDSIVDEGLTDGLYLDDDGDTYGNPNVPMSACDQAGDFVYNDLDCDDTTLEVYPGAEEVCNFVDDDCDGDTDESFDADGDGVTTCGGDCDDSNALVGPFAVETCNGLDDNCNGTIDEGYDQDNDGYTECAGDCDDNAVDVNPGADELCDGLDNNCNTAIDENLDADADGDGHYAIGSCTTPADDCDDLVAGINPDATETCNGIDDNCDGQVDEGMSTDADGDGYYTDGSCLTPIGDCDDNRAKVNPGATETCNGRDDNCDGQVDEGLGDDDDLDGHYAIGSCSTPADDCDDAAQMVYPGAEELCNGIDDDCNGLVDDDGLTDSDGDGHFPVGACSTPADDCDDGVATTYTGATELCNGIDDDCDGLLTADEEDVDGDGYGLCDGDCDDSNGAVNPGATETCNSEDDNCNSTVDEGFDSDNDGYSVCQGDCDDGDPAINAGASEICNGVDDDCDSQTDEGLDTDSDGDGHFAAGSCSAPADDCDDAVPTTYTGAPELCNGVDDDCNGVADDDGLIDSDGDGHYPLGSCSSPADDCDDTEASIYSGAPELCNGLDDDCDGALLVDEMDVDGDGFGVCDGDCDDNNIDVNPGESEVCNAIDDNCNSSVDEGFDKDGDSYSSCSGDCDDNNGDINPGEVEICNGADDDCNGTVDDQLSDDVDNDGHYALGSCLTPADDCADLDPDVYPGAPEICNGEDDDCNGLIDDDGLVDGDGDGHYPVGSCTSPADDCDDASSLVYPGAPEVCNGLDDDCDGAVDLSEDDSDGDGYRTCDGDCDDSDPLIKPGATELCNAVDDDCDTDIDEGLSVDMDGDGHNPIGDCGALADDCDDMRITSYPGAPELCNGFDDDCDGIVPVDEQDLDGDGFSTCAGDCDDDDDQIFPGQVETCDGVDEDCDGLVDEGFAVDVDGDGYSPSGTCGIIGDCDDSEPTVYFGAPELCDGLDNDCDGNVPGDEINMDGDVAFLCDGDCDDDDAFIYPGAYEWCNGVDDDCDLSIDEDYGTDATDDDGDSFSECAGDCDDTEPLYYPGVSWYADSDEDSYGDPGSYSDCEPADPTDVNDASDCDDSLDTVNPAATEQCDTIDNDCDGVTDEGCDYCGNGTLEGIEECDDGLAGNSDTDPDACRTDCLDPYCGDGVRDTWEGCDDGNNIDGDGCDNTCGVEPCLVSGDWTGTIYSYQSPCIVTADATVPVGETLTIEAGVVVKFHVSRSWGGNDRDITVNGTLNLEGTEAAPIVFTSYYDDNYAGDTNQDGAGTSPLPGDWGRLRFDSDAQSSLEWVEVHYGGGISTGSCCSTGPTDASVSISKVQNVAIDNLLVTESQGRGVNVYSSDYAASLNGLELIGNGNHGIEVNYGQGAFELTNFYAADNTGDGAQIVSSGAVSIIDSTSVDNSGSGFDLSTSGNLWISGSIGEGNTAYGVQLDGPAGSTVTGNAFSENGSAPAWSVPVLIEQVVNDNTLLDTEGGVHVGAGSISIDATWPDPGYVYQVLGDITVTSSSVLTLEEGVIFKALPRTGWSGDDFDLNIVGDLQVQGSATDPVVITSLMDDTHGGDSNQDGALSGPVVGDLGKLHITGTATVDHFIIRYGGGGGTGSCCGAKGVAALVVDSTQAVSLTNVEVSDSLAIGIDYTNDGGFATTWSSLNLHDNVEEGLAVDHGPGAFNLSDVMLTNNGDYGANLLLDGGASLDNIDATGNASGIYLDVDGVIDLTNSDISDNTTWGIYALDITYGSTLTDTVITGNAQIAAVHPNYFEPLLHASNTWTTGIRLLGGTLDGDAGWIDPGQPVRIEAADITVALAADLQIGAGMIFKYTESNAWSVNDGDFFVYGNMDINGTSADPVVFTSYFDDTAGGDTNGDSTFTSPSAGIWGRLDYAPGSSGTLDYVELRYGGGGATGSCCGTKGESSMSIAGTVDVANATVSDSLADGVVVDGGTGSFTDCSFTDNVDWGLYFTSSLHCLNWTNTGATYSGNGLGEEFCP
jgi:hypothetical protein